MQKQFNISAIVKLIKKLFYRILHFGLLLTFLDIAFEITGYRFICSLKHKFIDSFLKRKFKYYISEHYDKANTRPLGKIPKQAWICWWDGEDKMPAIVKACYNSILQNADTFKVTLISKYNFNDYIFIPEHVMRKVNNGKMSLTHFSNILRMALLYKYGGIWIDSTFLVTNKIELEDTISFFTRSYNDQNTKNIGKGRWSGNLIAGAPDFYFFHFIYNFLCKYWENFDCLMTYHLYDYSINLAYDSFPEIRKTFDAIYKENIISGSIKRKLEDEYDPIDFEQIINDISYHKLTWKHNAPLQTADNKPTFYGYILDKYQCINFR